MKRIRFFHAIGMAGVSSVETLEARIWARRFDIALIPVAIFALLAWYDNKRGQILMSQGMHAYADWILWGFFVAELLVLSWMVTGRWNYWRHNWFNLLVIVAATPALWDAQELGVLRAMRFILVIVKLANLSSTIRTVLSRNNLGITILSISIFVFCAGVMMAAIDPAIHTIGDGIWWAWVTVTTVGYGDVVPVSGAGRVLAGIVMLVGLGLFSLITANFSAFFVAREEQKIIQREEQLLEKEQQVIEQETKVLVGEDKIIRHLQMIEARIKALEEKIPAGKE
ncbi:MAG TPA: ion channel [Pseudomonadales bacterium]|nr:ion channel [Pseudomonadales bacterium]